MLGNNCHVVSHPLINWEDCPHLDKRSMVLALLIISKDNENKTSLLFNYHRFIQFIKWERIHVIKTKEKVV